ncbi:type VII secretion-associated serine protease mycosin [Paractinoplanes atraurantiacus]|uniref:Type VII secretion-associated serine protease mycosin n=1 Tax=Paractinoplanes atraurantiacus TaxID=1036182 RepID=A0A285F401_9ACTN|nr:type VII secretion-associated serine protease mycosin [Actinoplanes atraurantiacus]SNY06050.1 type VII secretion-associated serine protease mycosin [Actinoplanes atraurantiacus]
MLTKFGAAGVVAVIAFITISARPASADSFRNDQWHLRSLEISKAHSISKGAGISIAVIDTGVYPHADLRRNLQAGVNLAPGGGDGRKDQDGHGTSMAGIIAAHGRGGDGVLGIAPSSKILPVKITNRGNSMPAETMTKGVQWATQNGAEVINISAETGPAFDLADAVHTAISDDIVVVAGAGNKSKQAIMAYPAAIDGVLTVGATGRNGKVAPFSITGPRVQLCAPGVDITTTQTQGRYVDTSGTSAATAIVSGAAALVRAKFPQLSAEEVVHRITATADDIGAPGRDDECGFGRLNLVKALTATVPPLAGEASASPSAAASSAVTAAPAPTVSAVGAAQAGGDEGGGGRGLVYGGIAAVVALGGVLAFVLLRRRRGGL